MLIDYLWLIKKFSLSEYFEPFIRSKHMMVRYFCASRMTRMIHQRKALMIQVMMTEFMFRSVSLKSLI